MTHKQNPKSLSHSEIASFCSQMAMILRAGISSLEGIAIMKEEATSIFCRCAVSESSPASWIRS